MGDHKKHPRAQQLGADAPPVQLPDVIPGGDICWQVEPNKKWLEDLKALREAGHEGPVMCRESERDAVLYGRGLWTVPMRTAQQAITSRVPMAELGRMPLVDFKKQHKANFERDGHAYAANTIVIPPEDEGKLLE